MYTGDTILDDLWETHSTICDKPGG